MSATILEPLQKTCPRCKQTKVISKFNRCNSRKDGVQTCCRDCGHAEMKVIYYRDLARSRRIGREKRLRHIEQYRERQRRQLPEKVRQYRLKYLYGLTPSEYQAIYDKQRGCCAICGRFCVVLHVDHDHELGRVRGLLCWNCNHGLGYLRSIWIMKKAKSYLESHLVNAIAAT